MIAVRIDVATWMRTTVLIFDGDEAFRDQLQEQFAELGLRTRIIYDESDVVEWNDVPSEPAFFMLPLRGLGNRLAAIQEIRFSSPDIKLVLVSKDRTSRFINLCIGLGANAVMNRYESPEKLARLTMIVASGT